MWQLRALVEVWVQVDWLSNATRITVYRIKPFTEPRGKKGRLVHLQPDDALQFINAGSQDDPYRVVLASYPQYFVLEQVQDD